MAEAGGGRRWRGHFGELVAWLGEQAKGKATGSPRAGRSSMCWRCKRPEGGARRGHHWRRQWRLGSSVPGAMRAAASSTPFIGARAVGRGTRYGARAVRGATANGSLGAARRAYGDVRGSAGEVRWCGHWLGGGEVGLLGLRMWDAWRRGFGCGRRSGAMGPAVAAVLRRLCLVGQWRGLAWPHARRRAWARTHGTTVLKNST
jgi:hypothetical protein